MSNSGQHEHEPVEVAVVADKRDTFGKRLGMFSIGVLIFLVVTLGLIQLGKNGESIKNRKPVIVPTPSVIVTVKPPVVMVTPSPVLVPGPVVTVIKPVPVPQSSSQPRTSSSSPKPSPKPQPSASASPKPGPVRSVLCRVVCRSTRR